MKSSKNEKLNLKKKTEVDESELTIEEQAKLYTGLETIPLSALHQTAMRFTGEVHTLLFRPHQGFANFTVATLELNDGKVTGARFSDPYAGFEAAAQLTIRNDKLLEWMRSHYPPGFRHA